MFSVRHSSPKRSPSFSSNSTSKDAAVAQAAGKQIDVFESLMPKWHFLVLVFSIREVRPKQ